jgi:hypothetical protein
MLTDYHLTKVRVKRTLKATGQVAEPSTVMLQTAAQLIAVSRDQHETWEAIAQQLMDGEEVSSLFYKYVVVR